jgi:hypothetical protein
MKAEILLCVLHKADMERSKNIVDVREMQVCINIKILFPSAKNAKKSPEKFA